MQSCQSTLKSKKDATSHTATLLQMLCNSKSTTRQCLSFRFHKLPLPLSIHFIKQRVGISHRGREQQQLEPDDVDCGGRGRDGDDDNRDD